MKPPRHTARYWLLASVQFVGTIIMLGTVLGLVRERYAPLAFPKPLMPSEAVLGVTASIQRSAFAQSNRRTTRARPFDVYVSSHGMTRRLNVEVTPVWYDVVWSADHPERGRMEVTPPTRDLLEVFSLVWHTLQQPWRGEDVDEVRVVLNARYARYAATAAIADVAGFGQSLLSEHAFEERWLLEAPRVTWRLWSMAPASMPLERRSAHSWRAPRRRTVAQGARSEAVRLRQ